MRPPGPSVGLVIVLALVGASCADGADSATTVVVNARVRTMDEDRPRADAFAYDSDGTIVAVGTEQEVRTTAGAAATTVDAGGNLVLPGFQDSHVHVPEAGINEGLCLLPPGEPLEVYEPLVAQCADRRPDDPWVRAAGPSLFDLGTGDELPVDVLDRAVPDRPALILDDLGHAVWTNTAGLEAAGISEDDEDPQGGVFDRDPRTGRLSGLLLENAQHRVRDIAGPDADAVYEGLLNALDELAAAGITTISDAGGFWAQGHPEAWERAVEEGTVTVRALNSLYVYPDRDPTDQLADLERRFDDDPGSLVRFTTAKIYLDGIIDLGTATLLAPYEEPIDPDRPRSTPRVRVLRARRARRLRRRAPRHRLPTQLPRHR